LAIDYSQTLKPALSSEDEAWVREILKGCRRERSELTACQRCTLSPTTNISDMI
jgi:hypothetical protein